MPLVLFSALVYGAGGLMLATNPFQDLRPLYLPPSYGKSRVKNPPEAQGAIAAATSPEIYHRGRTALLAGLAWIVSPFLFSIGMAGRQVGVSAPVWDPSRLPAYLPACATQT